MNWIEIFRIGRHTDSEGRTKEWTERDLDHIVTSYDPSKHEAPIVIGHPKDNTPAYGWVEALKREGGTLLMKMKDVVPEFVDMLKNKMFKKRSISLYPDGTLRHVGWLGAMPPAVKGLADVTFKDGDESSYEFDEDLSPEKKAQIARSKKYGISIREDGNLTKPSEWDNVPDDEWLDPVNYAYPCPDADQTRAAAVYWGRERNRNKYSKADQEVMNERLMKFKKKFNIGEARKEENMSSFWERLKALFTEAGIKIDDPASKTFSATQVKEMLEAKDKEFSEEKKKKEDELRKREEVIKAKESEITKKEISSFIEGLAKEGKIVPAMMKLGMGLQNFLEQIAEIETEVEFGEEGKKEKQTPLEFMQSFLAHLPKAIDFKEVAGNSKDVGSGSNAEKRKALISEYMGKNKDAYYKQAVIDVLKEHPELREEE